MRQLSTQFIHYGRISAYFSILIGCIVCISRPFHLNHIGFKDVLLLITCTLQVRLITIEITLMKKLSTLPNIYLGLPWLGSFLDFLPPNGVNDMYFNWRKQALGSRSNISSNNEPFTLQMRGRPMVVISSDEDIAFLNNIERKGYTKKILPATLRKLFGPTQLMSVEGKHHRALRRMMEPVFAPSNLVSYTKTLDHLITKRLKKWSLEGTWHSTNDFKILTLRLLLCVIFEDITEELIYEFDGLVALWMDGANSLHTFLIPGTTFYKAFHARAKMEIMIMELITSFKKKYSDPELESEKLKTSFLGRLVYGTDENGAHLTELELKENILLILFAGHDTTYASIGTFLYYLTKLKPNVYDALIEEVHNIKEPLDNVDLRDNAPILNAFIAEAWRIMPPVVSFGRVNVSNNEIRYKNYVFPKGCAFLVNMYFNREEYYGKSANEFHMERWLPDDHPLKLASSIFGNNNDNIAIKDFNQISRAFKTFGVGTHSCLGHRLAKLEARIFMIRLLHYDIKLRDNKLMKRPFNYWMNEFQLSEKKIDS